MLIKAWRKDVDHKSNNFHPWRDLIWMGMCKSPVIGQGRDLAGWGHLVFLLTSGFICQNVENTRLNIDISCGQEDHPCDPFYMSVRDPCLYGDWGWSVIGQHRQGNQWMAVISTDTQGANIFPRNCALLSLYWPERGSCSPNVRQHHQPRVYIYTCIPI